MEERIYNKKIVLEDGAEFYGYGFGADREIIAELVFNTSMAGYQEILSDPSYTDQAVVMTYPLIGNYGMCRDDYETDRPTVSALIVREYCSYPSNFRCAQTLEQVMCKFGIVGIAGVDTRKLTRYIRDKGTCKALLTTTELPNIACVAILKSVNLPKDAVSRVSTAAPWKSPAAQPRFHVASVATARAKKRPLAPKQSSAGRNGSSTVPNGEDLLTKPRGLVGEYCPFVSP